MDAPTRVGAPKPAHKGRTKCSADWEPSTALDGLVRSLARRIASSAAVEEDLYQVGLIAAWQAEQRYQPGMGAKLTSYAFPAVRDAILDEAHAHQQNSCVAVSTQQVLRSKALMLGDGEPPIRAATAQAVGNALDVPESLDFILEAGADGDDGAALPDILVAESHEEAVATGVSVHALLDEAPLTERQRTVVQLTVMGDMPDADVAGRLGVDPSTISRERKRALKALRLSAGDPQDWMVA